MIDFFKARCLKPIILAGLVVSSGLLSACQPQPSVLSASASLASKTPFRFSLGGEPPTLDPAKASDLTSYTVILNLMRGLVQYNAYMAITPAMAQRWQVSADKRLYTFYLNPKARWSNGAPVTAQDFVRGFQRALNPKTGSDYAFFLFYLKNAKAYYGGKTPFSAVGIRALNNHVLRLYLERPVPFFLDILTAPIAFPESPSHRYDCVEHFVSNGPYVLHQWRHDAWLLLRPNPRYSAILPSNPNRPWVKAWMIREPTTSTTMYEQGDLDFIETASSIAVHDIRHLQRHPDAHNLPLLWMNYFGFSTHRPPFDQLKVRQAFSLALDRHMFATLLQNNAQPTACWLPQSLRQNRPPSLCGPIQGNIQKARQLLAQAGYPGGKGLPPITLAYRALPDLQREAEIAQYQWKTALGVDVQLQAMDWSMLLTQLSNQQAPALWRMGWYADYPHPDTFLSMFVGDSGNNYTGWHHAAYDAAVAQGNDAKAEALLQQAYAIIPLYQGQKLYLTKPSVSGLMLNGLNLLQFEFLSMSTADKLGKR